MSRYILWRMSQLVWVLLVVATVVFFVFHLVPGDLAEMRLGDQADLATLTALRHTLGLDRPLAVQYGWWLEAALRGDLGRSAINGQPVVSLVLEKFPATLELAVLGTAGSLLVSVPIAVLAALRQNSWVDQVARVLAIAGYCLPRYWLAVLLILTFAVRMRWLPPAGFAPFTQMPLANLQYAALPVLSLTVTLAAVQMRFLRSSLLDAVQQDYIRTASAKGLRYRTVVFHHALRNALVTFVTVVGLQFADLLGGLVVVEQIFSWPGVGWLMIESITERDYVVVQGAVLLIATGFVLVNLVVDVLYAAIDPRVAGASRHAA